MPRPILRSAQDDEAAAPNRPARAVRQRPHFSGRPVRSSPRGWPCPGAEERAGQAGGIVRPRPLPRQQRRGARAPTAVRGMRAAAPPPRGQGEARRVPGGTSRAGSGTRRTAASSCSGTALFLRASTTSGTKSRLPWRKRASATFTATAAQATAGGVCERGDMVAGTDQRAGASYAARAPGKKNRGSLPCPAAWDGGASWRVM